MNAFCVTRRHSTTSAPVRFPADNTSYRGGALPRMHRPFFSVGVEYRAPMFVATSFDRTVSVYIFLARLDPPSAEQQPPWQARPLRVPTCRV